MKIQWNVKERGVATSILSMHKFLYVSDAELKSTAVCSVVSFLLMPLPTKAIEESQDLSFPIQRVRVRK